MLRFVLVAPFILGVLAAWAKPGNLCERPRELGHQVVDHGLVSGQMVIDSSRALWGRLNYSKPSRLIEIERLWGMGSKTLWPELGSITSYQGVLLTFDLRSPAVFGVGLWQLGWFDAQGVFHDLTALARVLLDDVELQNFGKNGQIPRLESGSIRHLKILFPQAIPASEFKGFHFYGRTLFQNPMALKNILAGTRIDACAYFFGD